MNNQNEAKETTTDELIQYAKDTEDHIGITDDGFPEMTPNEQAIIAMGEHLKAYQMETKTLKETIKYGTVSYERLAEEEMEVVDLQLEVKELKDLVEKVKGLISTSDFNYISHDCRAKSHNMPCRLCEALQAIQDFEKKGN